MSESYSATARRLRLLLAMHPRPRCHSHSPEGKGKSPTVLLVIDSLPLEELPALTGMTMDRLDSAMPVRRPPVSLGGRR